MGSYFPASGGHTRSHYDGGEHAHCAASCGEIESGLLLSGREDKVAQAEALCAELGIGLDEVAFIGDDLNDLPLLRRVGLSASPVNTPDYVKREVDCVTTAHGGYGAFREFVEKLLADAGLLEGIIKECLAKG